MIGSYVINLFSKATGFGVSYTEHLFLTLRVVTGKLSNRSLKTKEMNYSKGLQLKNTDNHFQESEQNSPSSSVLSGRGEDSQPDTFVRSFSTNFTALAGKSLTFGNILSPGEEIIEKRVRLTTFMTPLPNSEIQPVKESELDSLHTL